MPKPIQPPAPAYGSPEWKAERMRMVGTPEWRAAQNMATPQEEFQYYVDDDVNQQIIDYRYKNKAEPTEAQIAGFRSGAEDHFKAYKEPTPQGSVGRRLGAQVKYALNDKGEKQFYVDKSGIGKYNPLYDPGSAEYKAQFNPPKATAETNQVTMPYTLQQQYQEPKQPTLKAGFQFPKPTVQGGSFKPPTFTGGTGGFQQGNFSPTVQPPTLATGGTPSGTTGGSFKNDQQFYSGGLPPVGVPQNNGQGGGGGSQLKIELPDIFKMNSAIAGPTTIPPLSIKGGITMPTVTPGVKPQSFPSMNWSDLLTVAHSR